MWRQTLTLAITSRSIKKGPTGHGGPAIRSKMPAAQKITPNSPTPIGPDQGTQARHEHQTLLLALTLNRSIGLASAQKFEHTFANCSAAVRLTLLQADISSSVLRYS